MDLIPETHGIVAGRVKVGTDTNEISMTDDTYLNINRVAKFDGKDANNNLTGIQGTIISPDDVYKGIYTRSSGWTQS